MDVRRVIGSCVPLFLLAVLFDIIGIILLFLGIFANLRIDGRFYGDFLIYTGSIILFFSIGLWLLWYLGNIPPPYDPLTASVRKRSSIVELARKFSQRLSEKLKTEVMGKSVTVDETSPPGTPNLKPGRVTWGKSTAYVNKGYEQDGDEEEEEESEDVKCREQTVDAPLEDGAEEESQCVKGEERGENTCAPEEHNESGEDTKEDITGDDTDTAEAF